MTKPRFFRTPSAFRAWLEAHHAEADDLSYSIRFTPRRARSLWSRKNLDRARELLAQGRITPAGLAAYEARRENRSGVYSYEQRPADLPEPYAGPLRRNRAAWDFHRAQPPSYRKTVTWWVVSAKREETRLRRLDKLIAVSAGGRRLSEFEPRNSSR